MRAAIGIALVLAGCSEGSNAGASVEDPGGSGDAPPGAGPCEVGLTVVPVTPLAGPGTRVTATVGPMQSSFATYHWHVVHDGAPVTATTPTGEPSTVNTDTIAFAAPTPGIYDVGVELLGVAAGCGTASAPVNVGAVGAKAQMFRLRVVPPPASAAPPFEKRILILGGAAIDLGGISIDVGSAARFSVTGPAGGTPAYLRFSPSTMPEAVVEGFADATGLASVRIAPQVHSVVVIPASPGLAPRRFTPVVPDGTVSLPLDAGTPITGKLHDATGGIAGATVQLSIDGVPSTVATTTPDGSFTVNAVLGGSAVTLEVMPPAATSLPRLSASFAAGELGGALDLGYTANSAPVSLAGTHVVRQGAALRNVSVTVVGSLPAGFLTTRTTGMAAAGDVRIAAHTDGDGALAGVRVPRGSLSAVIVVGGDDLAVVALDTTNGVPASLEVPGPQSIATAAIAPAGGAGLSGATLDLVPVGALAAAGAPQLHATAGTDGAFAAMVASGGHYELQLRDPAGRAAPLIVADREAASIAPTYPLPAALVIRGALKLGGAQALPGAAVQMLCDACSGVDRDRPISEAVSDAAGRFVVAVPDPGTM